MVRRLLGFVINPRRSSVRDVWVERFVWNYDGPEPQGAVHFIPDATMASPYKLLFFQLRGVSLPGAEAYPTFESLPQRFARHEFTTSKALTLREIRKTLISNEESQR
jgi:hypothetical protein